MVFKNLEKLNQNILYALLFTAIFGPAFLTFEFGPIHLFPYRILWLVLLPLTAIYLVKNYEAVALNISGSKGYFIYLLIWLLYGAFSYLWAVDKEAAVRQIVFLFIGISVIFLVTIYFRELKEYQIVHAVLAVALLVVIGFGIWTIISGQHLPLSKLYGRSERIPTAVFNNPNDLATYLVLSIPFVLVYIKYSLNLVVKLLSSAVLISAIFLLTATGSRANMLALAVGFLFWFIFLAGKKARLVSLITIVLIGILIAFVPLELIGDAVPAIYYGLDKVENLLLFFTGHGAEADISLGSRTNFFRNSFIYLKESYGFGVGAGNADYYVKHFNYYYTFGYNNLHNWWLEVAVNYGIFIFLGFVWYYLSLIRSLYRIRNKCLLPAGKMISEALLLSLVVFFFASMSPSSMFGLGPMWVLFAFATGFVNWFRNNNDDPASKVLEG